MRQLPLLAQRLPSARLFRTFTITGWENFAGDVAGERPDMLYAHRSELICGASHR
jgi:hypothetical protein